jgi:DNA-binding transcriptional ArsR family regulator
MRPKWDRRARQGETYGQGTIARAIANTRETYDPNRRRDDGSGGNGDAGGNGGRQVDPLTTINIARQWIKTHSFEPHIDPEFLAKDGSYRTEMTDRRVADAVLDVLQERGALAGFLPLREIRRRAGVGVETVRRAMARLMGWFVALSDHPQNQDAGGALHYILTFRADGTHIDPHNAFDAGCLMYAKSPFSLYKAADAFNVGGNRDMRNAALREVLGRAPVDVLIQLEAFDQPRRDAHTDYRKACQEVAALGEQMTPADVVALTRLADGLIDAPQPVTLAALSHIANAGAGVGVLAELGAVTLENNTICLLPNYSAAVGPYIASLGPVALLMIDASVEHGDLTYDEFTQHTGLKYGTLHRAMSKLRQREIYDADREGMIKRFTLRCDWLSEVQAQAITMRTYGLQQKRELADAKAVFDHCCQLIAQAAPAEQPKLELRRERAFNRLMAAVALEAPSLAGNVDFAVAMRSAGQMRKPQAPAMPEPGASNARLIREDGMSIFDAYAELAAATAAGAVISAESQWKGATLYA